MNNVISGLLSVIIPVYKTETYLGSTIESVLSQTYPTLEIILVNDGSPDGSPQICDEYAARYDHIRVVHKSNGGLSSARNAGMDHVNPQTEYILFLDSDDTLLPSALDNLVRVSKETNADVVLPDRFIRKSEETGAEEILLLFDRDSHISDPIRFALDVMMEKGRAWRATSVLYRYAAIQACNARFPEGYISEDISFNFQIMSNANKLAFCNKETQRCLQRKDSISNAFQNGFENSIWYIDQQARTFLANTHTEQLEGQKKVDALLCRNMLVFVSCVMASHNPMKWKEKARYAKTVLSDERTRNVHRKKHCRPWFESKKTRLAIQVVYWLFEKRLDGIAYLLLSMR